VTVPYGDLAAMERAMTADVVAVLIEPIQGEAGVRIPPPGYLAGLRELTRRHRVLLIADEIQSGLGRTGRTLACEHEGVVADMYLLGKALGGGIVPVSAVAADRDVLGVLQPGQHGSTFGGNPLACAVGLAVVELLETGEYQERATRLGGVMRERLDRMVGRGVVAVRSRGLWAGLDIDPVLGTGREVCEALARRRVLAKDTHGSTIRLAPPIVITEAQLHHGLNQLEGALADLS
jgi:ornithine--oxo-acid transaminase